MSGSRSRLLAIIGMPFAALRISEPSVVGAEGTSRRLLSPALALSFSYFRFLHIKM